MLALRSAAAEDRSLPAGGDAGATLPPALPALAQRWAVGYDKSGAVPCDAWIPVHLWLTNHTQQNLEGTWRVRIKDYRESVYTADYTMPVQLAGHGTQKHFIMHVYLPPGQNIFGNYDVAPEAWLENQRGLPIIARNALSINALLPQIRKTSAADGQEEKESFIYRDIFLWLGSGSTPPPLERRLAPQRRRALIAGQPEYLPQRWCAYAGFTAVIWDGGDLMRWEEAARNALMEYVAAGGHLIVAAGGNAGRLRSSFLAPLLPAVVEEGGEREAAEILAAASASAARLAFSRLFPRRGSLVLQPAENASRGWRWTMPGKETPLAARGDYGAGTVTVLAIPLQTPLAYEIARQPDSPLADAWHLWLESVLHRHCETLLEQKSTRLRIQAHKHLLSVASKPIPSRSRIFSFLLVYMLVSVPLLYVLARGFGRPEAAWLFLPFVACAFFGINYLYAFQHLKKDLAMTDLGIIRLGSGSRPEMAGGSTFSIVHNPTYRAYRVAFGAPQITPLYLRLPRLPSLADEILDFDIRLREEGKRVWLEEFRVPFNEARPLEAMHLFPLGRGLTLRLTSDFVEAGRASEDGVIGEADNGLDMPLFQLALLRGDKGWRLRPILAKTAIPVRLADAEAVPMDRIIQSLGEGAGQKQLPILLPLALAALAEGESRMALVAVLPGQTFLPWRVDDRQGEAVGTTVICLLLPYSGEPLSILGERLTTSEERAPE